MQTIARANRVFAEKENGLIVDYIGVFRNLEKALAIYGAGPGDSGGSLIQPTDEQRSALTEVLSEIDNYLADNDVSLAGLEAARGLEFVALQATAAELLLIDETTRKGFVALANRARQIYKALMPDPAALAVTQRVAVVRSIANKISAASEAPDISEVMDGVSALLDRSVGTREYIMRALGDEQALVDLNAIDWGELASEYSGNERQAAKAASEHLEEEIDKAVRKNPTVAHLAEKLRKLIDDYNAGTLNAVEVLRRLAELLNSPTLNCEQFATLRRICSTRLKTSLCSTGRRRNRAGLASELRSAAFLMTGCLMRTDLRSSTRNAIRYMNFCIRTMATTATASTTTVRH
jgi:type I restriction enzyme R subunit